MMRIFRKGAGPYALTEAMTGVRLGEQFLYVGSGDPVMFAALAGKVGVTGRARAIVESETASERVERAAASAGVLIEVSVGTSAPLGAGDGLFDVAVIDATGGMVLAMSAPERRAVAKAVLDSLRPRGRVVVVERSAHGVAAVFKGPPPGLDRFQAEGGASRMLEDAGFHPVRLLADKDGERFTEGWKVPAVLAG
jgi:hypothetical protein